VTSPICRRPAAGLGPGRASGRATLDYAASAKLSLAAKMFPGVFRGSEHLGTLPRLPVHASKPYRPQFSRSTNAPRMAWASRVSLQNTRFRFMWFRARSTPSGIIRAESTRPNIGTSVLTVLKARGYTRIAAPCQVSRS
jgi:hypothetical protein